MTAAPSCAVATERCAARTDRRLPGDPECQALWSGSWPLPRDQDVSRSSPQPGRDSAAHSGNRDRARNAVRAWARCLPFASHTPSRSLSPRRRWICARRAGREPLVEHVLIQNMVEGVRSRIGAVRPFRSPDATRVRSFRARASSVCSVSRGSRDNPAATRAAEKSAPATLATSSSCRSSSVRRSS